MLCSNCSSENAVGVKFCNECGTLLAAACPNCAAANRPGAKFCGECASPLAAASGADQAVRPLTPTEVPTAAASTASAAPAASVAERRLVSIMFADLVGFTTLSEGRDAEAVRELLSGYFELASEIVGRYGGTVEKFIGDAVMAVWGTPTAHEDDAERAVRAALDLVAAVPSLGEGVNARCGVLTGEAAVTIGATNQGMVAGDLVNTASRLQSAAPPGAVLAGSATQQAASAAIAFEQAGEQVLKGKAAPVPAWRALRVVGERKGVGRRESLEAPFVGRDEELRLLKELFHATSRDSRARLVSIMGPAGIGKSRLAWELLKYLDGVVETVFWHAGRSPSYGDGVSFWALGEMVRARAGLAETDDEATTRERIAATLREHVPDEAERRWIEPRLLALLGIGEAAGEREELFAAWRTFFERIAATGTVALIFEDLHWADAGTLDFIDHLLEWSRNLPIYIVTLARPELMERRPNWGAAQRNFTSIHLEPMPEPAMRELLSGLVPGLPDAAVRQVIDRADGVPLYAVETVRMLLADGRLAEVDGAYRPVGDLTELAVPDTLHALIAARLDGLDARDRALIADAAVLGQSFTLDGLAEVSGQDAPVLESRLRNLVRRELLVLAADPRSPERGQYAFVQSLIREVAYSTLSKRDRRSRHLAAARYFESIGDDELAGPLAAHYLAAHDESPEGPEREALAVQARLALKAAAARAHTLGSQEQAVRFLDQALLVTTDPVEAADLLERAGLAASDGGMHDVAEARLRRSLELRRQQGDRPLVLRTLANLGEALLNGSKVGDALDVLGKAHEELSDLGDDPALTHLTAQLARAHFFNEDNSGAIAIADTTLTAAERLDLVPIIADTLITKGSALWNVGRSREGLGLMKAGRDLAESAGLLTTLLRGHVNISGAQLAIDPRAGLVTARDGMAFAGRVGLGAQNVWVRTNAAMAAMRTGEWTWVQESIYEPWDLGAFGKIATVGLIMLRSATGQPIEDLLEQLQASGDASDDPQWVATLALTRTWVAMAEQRWRDAASAARAAAAASAFDAPWIFPMAIRAMLALRDARAARQMLDEFLATLVHGPAIDAMRRTAEAGLDALEGRRPESIAAYRDAQQRWRDAGVMFDLALCELDMVRLLGMDDPEVRAAAEECREILTSLGAKPYLAQLDAAIGQTEGPDQLRATQASKAATQEAATR